eukprot:3935707-Rhodomonas_salina.1
MRVKGLASRGCGVAGREAGIDLDLGVGGSGLECRVEGRGSRVEGRGSRGSGVEGRGSRVEGLGIPARRLPMKLEQPPEESKERLGGRKERWEMGA